MCDVGVSKEMDGAQYVINVDTCARSLREEAFSDPSDCQSALGELIRDRSAFQEAYEMRGELTLLIIYRSQTHFALT